MEIPYTKPTLGEAEADAVVRVIHSGWLAAGPETAAFEEEFSTYISPPSEHYYCIFTNSCTSALKMAFKYAKEIGKKSVYYPQNTFCATYSAAEEMGLVTTPYTELELLSDAEARPLRKLYGHSGPEVIVRFKDAPGCNLTTLIDEAQYGAMTVAMHYGGVRQQTYDIRGDFLVEDSAHRIEPNDPLAGKVRCYSFYATKNMTTGSGGMFVTKDKDIYERARLFWRDGLTTSTADRMAGFRGYRVEAMSGGYDGNDLAAAMGRVQLRRLPEFTERRNEIKRRYNDAFAQQWDGNHLYPYFVKDEEEVYRCIEWLKGKGISCSHNYPGTGWNGVSLPIYPLLTDEEVDYIIRSVLEYAQVQSN